MSKLYDFRIPTTEKIDFCEQKKAAGYRYVVILEKIQEVSQVITFCDDPLAFSSREDLFNGILAEVTGNVAGLNEYNFQSLVNLDGDIEAQVNGQKDPSTFEMETEIRNYLKLKRQFNWARRDADTKLSYKLARLFGKTVTAESLMGVEANELKDYSDKVTAIGVYKGKIRSLD